ncbi:MAG: ATP-binding cassette domain-containing protein, partial [Jaaginema sp. PMC 1080.18]|nr:ATP-binding cassette domain-containing protein [Jaaginema sp. PMC 1080.18]
MSNNTAFNLSFLQANTEQFNLELASGKILFILGANGTGKSSLLQNWYSLHSEKSKWIFAHRQNWFDYNEYALAPLSKQSMKINIQNTDRRPESRWKDDYTHHRPNMAIMDLIDAECTHAINFRNKAKQSRNIQDFINGIDISPLEQIEQIFEMSNIDIK